MVYFQILLLAVIQGITEFLPISSSGHLAIFQYLFLWGYQENDNLMYSVLLHFATLFAILIVYRKDIKEMIRDALNYLRMKSDSNDDEPIVLKPPGRALLFIIIGTLPLFIPFIFMRHIDTLQEKTLFVGFALMITGGLLFVSSRYIKQGTKTSKTMTVIDALVIGLAQSVAVLPGLSRSGTTIAVGLARGLSGSYAVKFSLLLSVPAVFGATIATVIEAIMKGVTFRWIYLIGFIIAGTVGYFMINLLRRIMAKGNFGYFSYYCWIVGTITIIWSLIKIFVA